MTQLATRQQKVDTLRDFLSLESTRNQIGMVAPKHLTVDRITRIMMTSVQRTPKLLECTQASLMGALLTCTQLGLEPDSVSGRAYLIPYKDQCTLIIGYKGLMELARRSGEIVTLEARIVYETDAFDYEYGTTASVSHKPSAERKDAKVKAAYAVAHLKSGGVQFEVMTLAEIEQIRSKSQAANKGPWVSDWNEMARKTVMRRLCKYLPSFAELSQAVALDELAERGIPQNLDYVDVVAESAPASPAPVSQSLEDYAAQRKASESDPSARAAVEAEA
jgi:recombination protein RecT